MQPGMKTFTTGRAGDLTHHGCCCPELQGLFRMQGAKQLQQARCCACCFIPAAHSSTLLLSVCLSVQDFEIDLDDDTAPTPAPKAALTAAASGGSHSASKAPAGPPAAGRVPSTHMQYVRPGLDPQQQQQQQAGFPGPPHAGGFGPGGMMQQGSGGLMGHGSGQMGAPHQQQQQQHYSLPVAAGGMLQQQGVLGGPQVPGPRPPPGGPRPPAGEGGLRGWWWCVKR